mgnify:CR=1 FL=1
MSYLVSIGLLVLVAGWALSVYNRLRYMREQVAEAWAHWLKATRQRNAYVEDFAAAVSLVLPPGDMLPRSLRKLAQDSRLALAQATAGRHDSSSLRASHAERELRRVLRRFEPTLESLAAQPSNEHLQFLGTQVNLLLFHQNQYARVFNRLAADYNTALQDVSGRILAPVFGFDEASMLEQEKTANSPVTAPRGPSDPR